MRDKENPSTLSAPSNHHLGKLINGPKDAQALLLGTSNVSLHGIKGLASMVKSKALKWGALGVAVYPPKDMPKSSLQVPVKMTLIGNQVFAAVNRIL